MLPYVGLAAALAVGLAVRLANLRAEPFWGDEILSLDIAAHFATAKEMLRYLAEVEFHPPLYYVLIRPWVAMFGAGEAAVRSLSVLAGLGVIAAVHAGAMRMFRSPAAANIAALVAALMPMQIEFGQEARPYALVALCGTVAAVALWEFLRNGGRAAQAAYIIASAAGLYLHYSYAFVIAATAAWWLFELMLEKRAVRGRAFLRWLVAHATVFILFYPWLEPLLYKLSLSQFLFFGMPRVTTAFREVGFFGSLFDLLVWTTKAKAVSKPELLAQFLVKISVFAAALSVARHMGRRPLRDRAGEGWAALYLGWLVLAPVLFFMLSPLSIPYAPLWNRHVIFVTVPLAMLLGFLGAKLGPRKGTAFAALLFVSFIPSAAGIMGNDGVWDHYHRIGEVGRYIAEHRKPGDLVIVAYGAARTDLAYYLPDDLPVEVMLPLPYYGNDMWASRHTLGFLENEGQVRVNRLAGGTGVQGGETATATRNPDNAVTSEGIERKLGHLVARHGASRVWLYSFADRDYAVHGWFGDRGWRRAFQSIGDVFALDLYSRE